jgi:hypothetical protein
VSSHAGQDSYKNKKDHAQYLKCTQFLNNILTQKQFEQSLDQIFQNEKLPLPNIIPPPTEPK